jgi:hypothetical protein
MISTMASYGEDGKEEVAEEDGEQEVEMEDEVEVEEVDDLVETQSSQVKKTRIQNYNEQEDIELCHAWMNVSLDTMVGTDQSKKFFFGRGEN